MDLVSMEVFLTCKGNEVVPNINCLCPPNYVGMFCGEKLENVNQIFFLIRLSSQLKLCEKLVNNTQRDITITILRLTN